MLLLNKKDIEKSVDLDGMMDQIEEAYVLVKLFCNTLFDK